ncbi:MAG TPA: hypothetical protein PLV68_00480, partial [Ilumatobacteraceae bacterium]|nr:hypothetical protein [Ilumatobacteraceae bacterium]
ERGEHPSFGVVTALGMVVARVGPNVVHLFATPLAVNEVHLLVPKMAAATINIAWDPVSCMSLVYSETTLGVAAAGVADTTAAMEDLMLRCAIEEISTAVAAEASRAGG